MLITSTERRAGAGWIRSALRFVLAAGLLLVAFAFAFTVAPAPARATNTLSNGTVSPGSGTTATVFTFSVAYLSVTPARTPSSVTANVGSLSIPLALTAGEAADGTYSGSSTLPAGSWPVTFVATVANGDATLDIGPVDVTPASSPTPTLPPTATPRPTPAPSAPATIAPSPTVPPATPTPAGPPPRTTPTPTPGSIVPPPPSTTSIGPTASGGTPDSSGSEVPTGSPRASSAEPTTETSPSPGAGAAATDAPRWRFGRGAWLLLGGTLSVAGAGILAGQWYRTRRRRPASATTPGRGPRPGRTAPR